MIVYCAFYIYVNNVVCCTYKIHSIDKYFYYNNGGKEAGKYESGKNKWRGSYSEKRM